MRTLLLAVVLLATLQAQTEHRERVEALAAELAELGFPIALESLGVEVADPQDCLADLDRQQDLFLQPSYFEGVHVLRKALGLAAGRDAKDFRKQAVLGYLSILKAYYQADRQTIVFLTTDFDAIANLEAIVAHELVHAYQDQQFGLDNFLQAASSTLDQTRTKQCVLEGGAEAVALAWALARVDSDLGSVDPAELDSGLDRLMAGEAGSLPYTVGRAYMVGRYHAGGSDALCEAMDQTLPSSEQVLHAEKLGLDLPTLVELPPLGEGLELRHDDVLGELEIYKLLLELGLQRDVAYIGAVGWDGDRLQVVHDGEGYRLRWRILWDRPEDAEQFRSALSVHAPGVLRGDGCWVDWSWAAAGDEAAALWHEEWGAGAPEVEANAADIASTRAIEQQRRDEQDRAPYVADGVWVVPHAGLRLAAPDGWQAEELRGNHVLVRQEAASFRDNVSVVRMPNVGDQGLEQHLALNKAALENMPGVVLDRAEITEMGGQRLLLLEYHGHFSPGLPALHMLALVYLLPGQQVVCTITMRERVWQKSADVVEQMLGGLQIDVPEQGASE